jgi:hypothetical protein
MPISNHPDDERLAALAGQDPDAIADGEVSSHVTSCDRCAALVDELGALRAALAELPDVVPSRPLRLLPTLEPEPASAADRLGGWARRFFAPVLASGAALALVGAIGTAGPAFVNQRLASAPSDTGAAGGADAAQEFAAEPTETETLLEAPAAAATEEGATRESTDSAVAPAITGEGAASAASEAAPEDEAPESDGSTLSVEDDDGAASAGAPAADQASVERSPWPMVLFAGVALMVAAVLLRWILAPRAA